MLNNVGTIYIVKIVNIDGGIIGKVYKELFFTREEDSDRFLNDYVIVKNHKETSRKEPFIQKERIKCKKAGKKWWRLYYKDKVDGIDGFCNWAYTTMIYKTEAALNELDMPKFQEQQLEILQTL